MILLILFYFALLVIVALLIAVGFSFYLKRRELPAPQDQRINLYPPHPEVYRPLFTPGPEELRALEKAQEKAALENEKEESRLAAEREITVKGEYAKALLAEWAKAPNLKDLGELLALAATTGSAEIYSEITRNVIQVWQDEKLAGLRAADLAALLDSHFRLLPQQEMASGALFWLKQEIAALREQTN